jgi:Spy/CpxP family protein refolding chaperone
MTNMTEKKMFRAAAVLLCAGGLMVSAAMAQQDAPPPPPDGQMQGPPPGGPGRGGPERRLEMLKHRLNLSDDQTAQVKSIFEGQRAKMEALHSNTSMDPQDRRAQMMAIRQDGEAKIGAILTPEQKSKYQAMEARHERRGGPDGPPPSGDSAPPPPPPAPQG